MNIFLNYLPLTRYYQYKQPEFNVCPAHILNTLRNIKIHTTKTRSSTGITITKNSLTFKSYKDLYSNVLIADIDVIKKMPPCVYLIGHLYIGQTTKLHTRLSTHFRLAINGKHQNTFFNRAVIQSLLNKKPMPLSILSFDIEDENRLIEEYSKKFGALTNIVSNFH